MPQDENRISSNSFGTNVDKAGGDWYNRAMKRSILFFLTMTALFLTGCDETKTQGGIARDGKLYILFEEVSPLTMEAVRTKGKCVAEGVRIEAQNPSAYHLCQAAIRQNERLQMKFEATGTGAILRAVCLTEKAQPNHDWSAASVEDYTDCTNGNLCKSGWNDSFWTFYYLNEKEEPVFSTVGLGSYPLKDNSVIILMFTKYNPELNP